MFEVPAAKRVKRSKLFEDNASDLDESIHTKKAGENSSDGSLTDVIPSYGFEYDFIDQQQQPQPTKPTNEKQAPDEPGQPQEEAEGEVFQFNLFRPNPNPKPSRSQDKDPSATPTAAPQNNPHPEPVLISLRSPSPLAAADPSLVFQQHRPDSYYFTVTALTPPGALKSLRASYAESAISAATINRQLARAWPGTYLPWRVVDLPSHARQVVVHRMGLSSDDMSRSVPGQLLEGIDGGRRARPSKKRREVRKGKARARQRIVDESKTKEEHEREKRNRKNRERKVKRRAKERREREEGRVGMGTMQGEGGGSEDDERSEAGSGQD